MGNQKRLFFLGIVHVQCLTDIISAFVRAFDVNLSVMSKNQMSFKAFGRRMGCHLKSLVTESDVISSVRSENTTSFQVYGQVIRHHFKRTVGESDVISWVLSMR